MTHYQDELNATRVQIEADMVIHNVELVDLEMVKTYAQELNAILQEADFIERKAFLKSFIKRIEIHEKQVVVHYNLPLPQNKRMKYDTEVLPFDTPGGPNKTFAKPVETVFENHLSMPTHSSLCSCNGEQSFKVREKGSLLAPLFI